MGIFVVLILAGIACIVYLVFGPELSTTWALKLIIALLGSMFVLVLGAAIEIMDAIRESNRKE